MIPCVSPVAPLGASCSALSGLLASFRYYGLCLSHLQCPTLSSGRWCRLLSWTWMHEPPCLVQTTTPSKCNCTRFQFLKTITNLPLVVATGRQVYASEGGLTQSSWSESPNMATLEGIDWSYIQRSVKAPVKLTVRRWALNSCEPSRNRPLSAVFSLCTLRWSIANPGRQEIGCVYKIMQTLYTNHQFWFTRDDGWWASWRSFKSFEILKKMYNHQLDC